ncbi:hypothetical protein NLI96_g8625 [Meripilus lineatus]|uniref:Uncharacterized protein n=1 Tax=Meripilus lineatus TaxID=2056292 RepID=A0AAD5UYT0_9APHY|nr:hypothetical protein NLI96_g8625 [Physisporinus lineatus]
MDSEFLGIEDEGATRLKPRHVQRPKFQILLLARHELTPTANVVSARHSVTWCIRYDTIEAPVPENSERPLFPSTLHSSLPGPLLWHNVHVGQMYRDLLLAVWVTPWHIVSLQRLILASESTDALDPAVIMAVSSAVLDFSWLQTGIYTPIRIPEKPPFGSSDKLEVGFMVRPGARAAFGARSEQDFRPTINFEEIHILTFVLRLMLIHFQASGDSMAVMG